MEQQIRFCTASDGVRIAYATIGEGPPLVMVRGWVSHLELDWQSPEMRENYLGLADRMRIIRYDKRGTGLSDRGVTDFSLEARVRDLEAVVDAVKLERFALQAYSEGGPVAIAYAARYPGRVSELILWGSFARGSALGRPDVRDALVKLVQAEWGLGSEALTGIFMPGASSEEHAWFVDYQRQAARRNDAAEMLLANYATNVSDLLPKVKAPTLVIHARGDRAIPFEQGRELASGIPNARLMPIESDRHAPDLETAAQIRQAVVEFVLHDDHGQAKAKGRSPTEAAPLTLLFTDIVSSTALTQRLGDAKAQEIVRAHNGIVRDALTAHAGSEIKHTGDGIMASFASPSHALECAVAIQRAVAARADEQLAVHIGINAGEPIAEDDDLFGTSVQLARRICDQAEGGDVLVSDVVRQLVAGKGFLFADRGDVALRGFEDPVRVYELRWRDDA
jgi:class 3 adenylate cyclase